MKSYIILPWHLVIAIIQKHKALNCRNPPVTVHMSYDPYLLFFLFLVRTYDVQQKFRHAEITIIMYEDEKKITLLINLFTFKTK